MIGDRERELISAADDGALEPEEQVELDELLASSAEAREFKAELDALDELLQSIPALDPPASLHATVMARAKSASGRSKPSTLGWLRTLRPGAGLRYALAAATGALVAAIFLYNQPLPTEAMDMTRLVGTMAPSDAGDASTIIDTYTASDALHQTSIQLRRNGETLLLDVISAANAPIDISVDLVGTNLWPNAVAQFQGRADSISIAGQAIELRANGQQRSTILLRRTRGATGETTIALEFSSAGKLLQRGTLTAKLEGVRQ